MNSETSQSDNVDQVEIDKFAALASRWWDTQSELKTLHDINPLRIDYIEQQCAGLDGKQVLDIGCGGGILAEAMAAKGATVTGIDMADASLEVARMHLLESGLEVNYLHTTAEEHCPEHPQHYDVITCMELLEHVPDPSSIITAAATALKPDGKLLLSTLNRNRKSFMLAIVAAEYIMQMLPKGTHDYNKFLKPSELARAARANGLQVIDISGMTYHPVSKHYALSSDVDVNYLMTCSPL